jgi:hypothetical protein
MLINYGDPFLFRWHKVKALKLDNVKLALDSAVDDFFGVRMLDMLIIVECFIQMMKFRYHLMRIWIKKICHLLHV